MTEPADQRMRALGRDVGRLFIMCGGGLLALGVLSRLLVPGDRGLTTAVVMLTAGALVIGAGIRFRLGWMPGRRRDGTDEEDDR